MSNFGRPTNIKIGHIIKDKQHLLGTYDEETTLPSPPLTKENDGVTAIKGIMEKFVQLSVKRNWSEHLDIFRFLTGVVPDIMEFGLYNWD